MFSKPYPSSKIKVPISCFTRKQLEIDMVDYGLETLGKLCNIIIAQYDFWPIPGKEMPHTDNYKMSPPIQFNVYKKNLHFINFVESHENLKRAAYCRYLFEKYTSLPRCRRELFVQSQCVKTLESSIENRASVALNYRGERHSCIPCFIAFSPSLARAYVVVYEVGVENSPDCFRTLRIAHIRDVAAGLQDSALPILSQYRIKQQIDLYREHFDPYLSYGKKVRIRLTAEGERMLRNIVTNRPEICGEPVNGIYEFYCTETHAKHYFAQFLKEAEVLSPFSLREWFAGQFQQAVSVYNKEGVPLEQSSDSTQDTSL
ncbi:WYL domain-containing protein [Fibrobacter intestinalis]|uniref:WYL domain-containing protein n=1 Tax=Fibrobacter intestinalis TaxID=28122 RepID=A0A1T4REN0_9BACT|nr:MULTISPECIES: WYL domain-containing protein [Fibrobacter]PBC73507.1 DeoR family transcriptional regulator [Fibrobacter sp. NR9]SKA14091.1 WYL domain-containing protein [Fibrobacter intestinalis]